MTRTGKVILFLLFLAWLPWAISSAICKSWPRACWKFKYQTCLASAQGDAKRLKACRGAYNRTCLDAAFHNGMVAVSEYMESVGYFEKLGKNPALDEVYLKKSDAILDAVMAQAKTLCNPD
jgi:hypothetical protein